MKPIWIRVVLGLQAVTAVLFVIEFLNTVFGVVLIKLSWEVYELIELGILVSLFVGMGLSAMLLRDLSKRNEKVEDQLMLASGEFAAFVEQKFDRWDLTAAERDVALLTLKGYSVPDIAALRNKSLGTIKSQNAAIYRKSAVSGRTQLIASLIEDMVDQTIEKQGEVETSPS